MIWIILAGVLAVVFYLKIAGVYKHWEKKGIAYLKPWPFVGNMGPNFFRKRAFSALIDDFYTAYPDKRYVGFYQFLQPVLMLRDPDLIKTIAVKEFNNFPDHNLFKPSENDDLANRALFSRTSKTGWHEMRATLSPSFTSSKLRNMFLLMDQCADQFTRYFEKQEGTISLNVKDAFTRFANDVVGTTAFGITCDSLENPENDFYLMGKDFTDFSGFRSLIIFGNAISPKLMKLLKRKTFSEKSTTFFAKIIKETIKLRQEKQIVRPDMIHLLMEARKGDINHENHGDVVDSGFAVVHEAETKEFQKKQKQEITDDDILAQAIGFFLAGFDTSSTVLSFLAYELAVNPDIQDRLKEEINSTLEECNGNITYEALLGMKYLDCIVSETLRLWPPAGFTDRTSINPFTIEPEQPGEKQLHLEPGTVCWIPIYPIQRDPKYYPDPEKFDPERFSDENKHRIKPFTYLPFGAGPRNCIGSRFALLEAKLLVVKMLQTFDVVPVEKTQIPILLTKKSFVFLPDDGIWLGLKRRKVTS